MEAAALDTIQELALRIIESEGLELLDLEFKMGKTRGLLRIFVDKAGGVALADCENVSRQLSAVLDVKDLIPNAYVLEVSSPGIDRPFRTDRDYERSLGKAVKVQYSVGEQQSETVVGTLLEVNDQEIMIRREERMQSIRRDAIRRVHQEIILPAHPQPKRKKHHR